MSKRAILRAGFLLLGLCACSDTENSLDAIQKNERVGIAGEARGADVLFPADTEILALRPPPNPERNAYFGDLHVHTANSFDAYVFGTISTPDDAYRYAKGQALDHPSGYQVQLQQPLDFYAVTDHAELLGVVREAANTNSEFSRYAIAKPTHNINAPDNMTRFSLIERGRVFASFMPGVVDGLLDGSIDRKLTDAITKSAWRDAIRAANEAYVPGLFTTFAGFEYTTSSDDQGNLHRNVIFRDTERVPALPFSRFNSQNPEGLWRWMDALRAQGVESLAIPHNSNGSNGQMFTLTDWAGNPQNDDYANTRLRNEPLVEITQIKGTSDTHPLLSRNDEWADFEITPYRVATKLYSEPAGSYVRDAYLRGLQIQAGGVMNPYKFGLIGSSDTHDAASSIEEKTFFSKTGLLDGTAELRGSIPSSFFNGTVMKLLDPGMVTEVDGKDYLASSSFEYWSASGLAGVWAEENTRESIYQAMRRKETFATSGPRIRVRFFSGYDFTPEILQSPRLATQAYQHGVAMGSDLPADGDRSPAFIVWAAADPTGTALQRAQVIKGYLHNGEHLERIYDVACSNNVEVDPATGRCPDNGATVDITDCSVSSEKGASELKALWHDPDFNPRQEAFYYVRVLENPTCRWSTWDAIRAGEEPRSDLPRTLQERAWSSPIWYRPASLAAKLGEYTTRPDAGWRQAASSLEKIGGARERNPPATFNLTGRVVRIADGDTVTVLDATNTRYKVRLYGIDTPERGQPFGNAAKKALIKLLEEKPVGVVVVARDDYGRKVGTLYQDGVNINVAMVASGYAWWYRHYAPHEHLLAASEQRAREQRLGLWAEPHPVAPWEWRRGKR